MNFNKRSSATKRAFLLAATSSGAGKTTITLGLLAALSERMDVQPFKCGPDFIDPTLHKLVSGKLSRNLDLKMCGLDFVANCFNRYSAQADITVIEGVMGLFDGGEGSGAALAKALGIPVILVVDAKACAESIAAVVKGFESLDATLPIAGVILNRVGSPRHLSLLSESVAKHCKAPIIGAMPRDAEFTIPERHLGLFMGDESPFKDEQISHLCNSIKQHIDLDALLKISEFEAPTAPPLPEIEITGPKVRIAIAQDRAFCFYYQDNLDLLESYGASFIPFSPLKDSALPAGIDAVYLPGGYPELYAEELSKNLAMRRAINKWSFENRPLYAECGGFMYLCQGISDHKDSLWPMCDVFPIKAHMLNRLSRLGYREVKIQAPCCWGNGTLHGHEFHYSDIDEMPPEIKRSFQLQDGRLEGYQINNTLATYVHLHLGRILKAAEHFIEFCQAHRKPGVTEHEH